MFLDFFKGTTDYEVGYPIRYNLAKEHYDIKLNDPSIIKDIEYEKFDYNIIKVDYNPYANTLVNEMWPFFRMLWKCRGGYTAVIKYNPDIDIREFGYQFGPGMLNAVYKFEITDDGKWKADFDFSFEQTKWAFDPNQPEKAPFFAQDYSRLQSNTAIRARRLAKPSWSSDTGRTDQELWDIIREEQELNKTIDWSFKHHYVGEGDWGNYKQFETEVADQMRLNSIPEKEEMFSTKEVSISKITKRQK